MLNRVSRLTSLLGVEERLTEAGYFAQRLFSLCDTTAVGYELNAFLSAARTVTFLLQKEFNKIGEFPAIWASEQKQLRADEAARFFVDLRNYSQKEGRIAIVGTRADSGTWRFMFAGTTAPVPAALLGRDVADCCLDHLAKVARAILRVADALPFHSCPKRALTPEGAVALGLDLDAMEFALGIPPEVSAARPPGSLAERTRLIGRYVDEVDFLEIGRIAEYEPLPVPTPNADFGMSLGLAMTHRIERSRITGESYEQAVRAAIISETFGLNLDDDGL